MEYLHYQAGRWMMIAYTLGYVSLQPLIEQVRQEMIRFDDNLAEFSDE